MDFGTKGFPLTVVFQVFSTFFLDFSESQPVATEWCIQPSTVHVAQDDLCSSSPLAAYSRESVEWHAMRGERESSQLVVTRPPAGALSVVFSALTSAHGDVIGAEHFSHKQVMYVFCRNSTLEQTTAPAWFADPLLDADASGSFPVEAGSTQPVWLSVDVPRSAAPGLYTGTAALTIDSAHRKLSATIPISLEVWNLTVPDLAASSFTLTFSVGGISGAYYNNSAAATRQFFDMLTSYRMPPDRLYRSTPIPSEEADYLVSTGTKWFNLLDLANVVLGLQKGDLDKQATSEHRQYGLYREPSRWTAEECIVHANVSDEILNKALAVLAPLVSRSVGMGYASRTYIYGFDESPPACLDAIRRVFGAAKARWPHIHTTAVLNWPSIPADIPVDTWVFEYHLWDKSPESHIRTSAEQFMAKRPDRRIFFYHCVDPASKTQLNSFIDRPLMETRLLFWDAAATSPAVSGWLYYAVNSWNITKGSSRFISRINNTARSAFNVARDFGSDVRIANGDGVLIYPGENGPVASVRMEAFRDGAEDLELLRMLPAEKAQPLVEQLVRASDAFTLNPRILDAVRQSAARMASSPELPLV